MPTPALRTWHLRIADDTVFKSKSLYPAKMLAWLYLCRFGMGKQSLENKVIEESSYLTDEIRQKNGEPFDVSVRATWLDLNTKYS